MFRVFRGCGVRCSSSVPAHQRTLEAVTSSDYGERRSMECGSNVLEAAGSVESTETTPARAKCKHRTGAQPLALQAALYPVLLVPVFLKDTRTLAGCSEEQLLQVFPPQVVQCCSSSSSSSSNSSSNKRKKHATTAQQGVLPAQGHLQQLTVQQLGLLLLAAVLKGLVSPMRQLALATAMSAADFKTSEEWQQLLAETEHGCDREDELLALALF
jgi:hypothetical protein